MTKLTPVPKVSGGAFVQTVEIKTWASSVKVDVNDDVNALALFLAAPEMLEALQKAEIALSTLITAAEQSGVAVGPWQHRLDSWIKPAIAKATGGDE